jgi:hypothetical protein
MYFLFLFSTVTMVVAIFFIVSIMCQLTGLQKQKITDLCVFLSTVILFSGALTTALAIAITELSWQIFPIVYSSVVLGISVAVTTMTIILNKYKEQSLKSFVDF